MNKHERIFREYDRPSEYVIFEDKYGAERSCEKVEIAEAFIKYWWSFVHCLWEALIHADRYNSDLVLKTWSNYVEDYFNTFILKDDSKL